MCMSCRVCVLSVTNEFILNAVVCWTLLLGRSYASAGLEAYTFWPFASHKFHQTYTDELVYIHCLFVCVCVNQDSLLLSAVHCCRGQQQYVVAISIAYTILNLLDSRNMANISLDCVENTTIG